MVDLGSDYWHTLDRKDTLKPKEFGISSKMGDVVQNLKADITAGASHVELGFMGAGKVFGGDKTPESFDNLKREEIRQMAKVNNVTVSTHASLKLSGMTGLDREQKFFSDRAAENNLIEIKRTIDFAGEACNGGPVVVHTDEFPREVSRHAEFEVPGGELEKEEIVSLVDESTAQLVRFQKGQILHMPKHWKKTKDGKHYVDIEGNPINDEWEFIKRVPDTNKDGEVDFEAVNFNTVKKWTEDYNQKHPNREPLNPDKQFFLLLQKSKLEQAAPFAHNYGTAYKNALETVEKAKKHLKDWEKGGKAKDPESERYMFEREHGNFLARNRFEIKKEEKPTEALKRFIKEHTQYAQAEKEGYIGYAKQIEEIKHLQKNVTELENYGVRRSAKYMAKAALYALQKEEQLKKRHEHKDMKEIFIAPENVFPEGGYGAHPDELKRLVEESRDKMVTFLTKREIDNRHNPYYKSGLSKQEAKKLAESHIKATFDIGHAYTWKKFFKGDPKKTPEQNSKDFEIWLMRKVDELNKDKIIGHVHVSDNMGYFDEHLTPGYGEVPIDQFVKKMKEAGHDRPFVVEWGAQSETEPYGAMLGAWANVAKSPIYRIDGTQQSWSDIENVGYFGRSSSPNFTIGKYGPSKDWNAWGWSEAQIE